MAEQDYKNTKHGLELKPDVMIKTTPSIQYMAAEG
jgi:hypothetical protein